MSTLTVADIPLAADNLVQRLRRVAAAVRVRLLGGAYAVRSLPSRRKRSARPVLPMPGCSAPARS